MQVNSAQAAFGSVTAHTFSPHLHQQHYVTSAAPSGPLRAIPPVRHCIARDTQALLADAVPADKCIVVAFVSDQVPGGTGKTTWARTLAHALEGRFPGHHIEVEWPRSGNIDDVMRTILHAIGRTCPGRVDPRPAYHACFGPSGPLHDSLLLLDGLRHDEDVRSVGALLAPPDVRCCFLITSRCRLRIPCTQVPVGTFTVTNSMALFHALLSESNHDIPGHAILERLSKCCAGIPLAVSVIAGTLTQQPTRNVRDILALLERGTAQERLAETDLERCFTVSYDLLTNQQRFALCLSAVWEVPFEERAFCDVASRLLGTSPVQPASLLHQLCSSALLERQQKEGRFTMHDLVRDFALQRAERCVTVLDHSIDEWRQCIISLYSLPVVLQVETLLHDAKHPNEMRAAISFFQQHRPGIEACVEWLVERKCSPLLLPVALAGRHSFFQLLAPRLSEKLYRTALTVADFADSLHLRVRLGEVLAGGNRYEEAEEMLRDVLAQERTHFEPLSRNTLVTWHALAQVLADRGRTREAEQELRQVLDAKRSALPANDYEILLSQHTLGQVYLKLGKLADAARELEYVVAAKVRLGFHRDHRDVLLSRIELALVWSAQGHYQKAGVELQHILTAMENLVGPENREAAVTRYELARVLLAQNRHEEAEKLLRQTLKDQLGYFASDRMEVLSTRRALAESMLAQRRYGEAIPEYRAITDTKRRACGFDDVDTLEAHCALARALATKGDLQEAEGILKTVLVAFKRMPEAESKHVALTRAALIKVLMMQNKQQEATEHVLEGQRAGQLRVHMKRNPIQRPRDFSTLYVALLVLAVWTLWKWRRWRRSLT